MSALMEAPSQAQAQAQAAGMLEADAELAKKIGLLKTARQKAKAWADHRDELTNEIKQALDGYAGAQRNGVVLATLKKRAGRRYADMDMLKLLVDADTYDKIVKSGAVVQVLDLR